MRDEGVVGQHRAGGHHLRARHHDPGVGFLFDVTANIADLARRAIAVDRRMNDGVIDERHALLAEFVPALGVVLIRIIELGVGAERRQKRRLVVGRTAEPSVGELRPLGDGVPPGQQIVERFRRLEERVGLAAVAGVSRHHDLVGVFRVVQRIVKPGHHARGVAEGRVRRDVLHALAVDVNRAVVAERLDIFRAGLRRVGAHRAVRLFGFCRAGVGLAGYAHDPPLLCLGPLRTRGLHICSIIELMYAIRQPRKRYPHAAWRARHRVRQTRIC